MKKLFLLLILISIPISAFAEVVKDANDDPPMWRTFTDKEGNVQRENMAEYQQRHFGENYSYTVNNQTVNVTFEKGEDNNEV